MRMLLIWLGFLCSLPARWLVAQQNPDGFARWAVETATVAELYGDYRYEGVVLGGVTLGAMGAWVGSRFSDPCPLSAEPGVGCRSDRLGNAVALGLTGAALGAGLGYLVGRFSPKRPPPSSVSATPSPLATVPVSVRRKAGYQHWRGAAIGSGVGAVLGTVLALTAGSGCADCTVTTDERVGAALVVTGIGGVAGFLAGLASPKYVRESAAR